MSNRKFTKEVQLYVSLHKSMDVIDSWVEVVFCRKIILNAPVNPIRMGRQPSSTITTWISTYNVKFYHVSLFRFRVSNITPEIQNHPFWRCSQFLPVSICPLPSRRIGEYFWYVSCTRWKPKQFQSDKRVKVQIVCYQGN